MNAGRPTHPLTPVGEAFVDDRGSIQLLVQAEMHSAVLIHSKKGTIRGNHYHRTDWHYCFVVSGTMEYYYRPHEGRNPPAFVVVTAGQMIFTPPMVAHAMRFLEDTVFLALARNARDPGAYEADIVRVTVI